MFLKHPALFAGGSGGAGRIGNPLVAASSADARAIDDDIDRALAMLGKDEEALSEESALLAARSSLIDLEWIDRMAEEEARRVSGGAR